METTRLISAFFFTSKQTLIMFDIWFLIFGFPSYSYEKELPGNKWKLKIHIIDNGILFDCFNLKKSHKRRFQVYVNVRYFFALNRDLIRSYYLTLYLMHIWNYYIHCSITWQVASLCFKIKLMEDEIKILFGCPIRCNVETTQGFVDIDVQHSF